MTQKNSEAAEGQSNLVRQVEVQAPPTEDELRRAAVEHLAQHMEIGAALIARCEHLAMAQRGDRLAPIYAAARLMRAQAHVADALAHVAQVERRRRSIVERIQHDQPTKEELIQEIEREKKARSLDPLAELEDRLDRLLQAEIDNGRDSPPGWVPRKEREAPSMTDGDQRET